MIWMSLAVVLAASCCLPAFAEHPCGDGICEGPETEIHCPEDCGPCVLPNPVRADVFEDLVGWRNWMEDGGFELGTSAVYSRSPIPRLSPADVVRIQQGGEAHAGSYVLRVETGAERGTFSIRSEIEKGETTRYSIWARSTGDRIDVDVNAFGVQENPDPAAGDLAAAIGNGERVTLDREWQQIVLQVATKTKFSFATLTLEIPPNSTIEVDDGAIEAELWQESVCCAFETEVGGLRVPLKPVAPFHFNVLMHIEDPVQLTTNREYFWFKTTVFRELARVLHEHGGFLTIQPEEDWVIGPDGIDTTAVLTGLAEDYGVVYSTHTHGPNCLDDQGIPRSSQDCGDCQRHDGCQYNDSGTPDLTDRTWDEIESNSDDYTPIYVDNLRQKLNAASGTRVTDHNGNWRYEEISKLASMAGIRTLSAYKNASTQSTMYTLYTNPWRPTPASAVEEEDFLIHDPTTEVIFIPGWGQQITMHLERLRTKAAAMLGRVLWFADASRINTFYIVTHIGQYEDKGGEPYITILDDRTGEATWPEDGVFAQHLQYWEELLSEVIDPLVDAGYVQWTSLPDIGDLFVEWEANCAGE